MAGFLVVHILVYFFLKRQSAVWLAGAGWRRGSALARGLGRARGGSVRKALRGVHIAAPVLPA